MRQPSLLKRFLISLLGSLAAFWLSIIIVIAGLLMIIGSLFSDVASSKEVKKNSILYINLGPNMPEREGNVSFQDILESTVPGESLENILNSIRIAANDKKIKGIFLDCNATDLGVASLEEIAEAIRKFKKESQDKFVIAYGDVLYEGAYLVAAEADKIYLNPVGSLDIHGMGAVVPFFKNLLDKVGVEMQIVKVGTYKSAVEPFILTGMSEASKEQTLAYADSVWSNYRKSVADARGISPEVPNMWADSMIATWSPKKVLENKAVTDIAYRREVEKQLRELTNTKDEDPLRFVTPSDYIAAGINLGDILKASDLDSHIAVYYAFGDIVDGGNEGIVGPAVVSDILALADDEKVAGLVLRVNSGGGSAFASEQIWEALEYFKSKDKPFYVSMGDYAASGGYYISCGADSIFADPSTLTGSIGIFGMIPNVEKLTDKIGVNFDILATNPKGLTTTPWKPMTEFQKGMLQKRIEELYELFVTRVAEGRRMPADSVKVIGEGRIWVGSQALKIGLVDRLTGLEGTIGSMCDKLGYSRAEVKAYPDINIDFWTTFAAEIQTSARIANLSEQTKLSIKYARYADKILKMNPCQARMPEIRIR